MFILELQNVIYSWPINEILCFKMLNVCKNIYNINDKKFHIHMQIRNR